jgi:DNA repair protein RecN (Recombination protein N)
LEEILYQMEDAVGELRAYLSSIQMDDQRLESIEDRLDVLFRLKRKYGGSLESVLAHSSHAEKELADLENIDHQKERVDHELNTVKTALIDSANKLSLARKTAAAVLEKKVVQELKTLKMSPIQFKISIETLSENRNTDPNLVTASGVLSETGLDRAEFLIAPNIGERMKPLAAIASGGELSRVVLALKVILASTNSVETIIFDEVDAGIGGGVAEVVGKKLASLASHHQVVCITHLPQIAKFGDHHFRISKRVVDERTCTVIQPLSENDRLDEIARMLGGEKITRATLDHAREMLNRN